MKKRIISIVKSSKLIYSLYFYALTFCINMLKKFIKPDDNLILFVSFGGKKYDDSPKAIYEEMIADKRFDNFEIVWAFNNPNDIEIPKGKKVKTDTFKYFKTALKARCWVTNSTVERGLSFRGKNTFYFNTWHGTPIKKIGNDTPVDNQAFKSKSKFIVDSFTVQGNYEANIFSRAFDISEDKLLKIGLPRNDMLIDNSVETKENIMRKLGININKKVILYAPTFREYDRDITSNCIFKPPINFNEWRKELGSDYLILFRSHYEVAKSLDLENYKDFVKDVSQYPCLNELMQASDIMISDYSSIFFDYAILNRPMICFSYDYEEYNNKRGLYFDIRKELLSSESEENLLLLIKKIFNNTRLYTEKTILFKSKYIEHYGNASKLSVDKIYDNIKCGG